MTRIPMMPLFSLVSAVSLFAFTVQAQAQGLSSEMSFKVVEMTEDGTESLVERDTVRPGEMIEYAITHHNGMDADLLGLAVAVPVPAGVTYVPGNETSSLPANFEVQAEMEPEIPGLEWSALPAFRIVIDATGAKKREPLPAEAIEAVRWNLDAALSSGETALNSYRVVVN